MSVTYTLKQPVGKRRHFMFDGIIYASDILKFEGINDLYKVTERTLTIPFDLDQPITDVMLDTVIFKP